MHVVVRELHQLPDLHRLIACAPNVVWLHGHDGMIAAGEAVRYGIHPSVPSSAYPPLDAPTSKSHNEDSQNTRNSHFNQASQWWNAIVNNAVIDDGVSTPDTGLCAFGSFSFDPDSPSGSVLIVPEIIIGRRGEHAWITIITELDPEQDPMDFTTVTSGYHTDSCSDGNIDTDFSERDISHDVDSLVKKLSPSAQALYACAKRTYSCANDLPHVEARDIPSANQWQNAVECVRDAIRSGHAQKVVLARQRTLTASSPLNITAAIAHLHTHYPSTWVFAIDGLIGATPEMLVSRTSERDIVQNLVKTRVLAGTITGSAQSSAVHSAHDTHSALTQSHKDQHEHQFAIDSVIRSLQALGETTASEPFVIDLPNVSHLATDVCTQLLPHTTIFDAVGALHPTAALGGTPRDEALEYISLLELNDRGRFGAPVGWISSNGASQWCVSLRCAKITTPYTAQAYAGAGIVAESDPEKEVAETAAKFLPIMDAFNAYLA